MDPFDALERARVGFEDRLVTVGDGQWSLPTPCDAWDVRGLVNHVVTADTTSVRLLHGAGRADVVALIGSDHLGRDALDAYSTSALAQLDAFREPGALDRVVPHPAFDMPGSQLLDFRVGDTLLHTWDLARAIGGNESLDPSVVSFVWASLEPLGDLLVASGAFGQGTSGTRRDDAPLQARLLDLTGRRP